MTLSKKLRATHFVLSISFAFMATKLAAIGQEFRLDPAIASGGSDPGKADTKTRISSSNKDSSSEKKVPADKIDRPGSAFESSNPKEDTNPTSVVFEVDFVTLSGFDWNDFLLTHGKEITPKRGKRAWLTEKDPSENSKSSGKRWIRHSVPYVHASENEPVKFEFAVPIRAVSSVRWTKYGGVQGTNGSIRCDVKIRLSGKSGPESTMLDIEGSDSAPKAIYAKSFVNFEDDDAAHIRKVEKTATPVRVDFEVSTEIPHGKFLVIEQGQTLTQIEKKNDVLEFDAARKNLKNRGLIEVTKVQRYLIVKPK